MELVVCGQTFLFPEAKEFIAAAIGGDLWWVGERFFTLVHTGEGIISINKVTKTNKR